MHVILLWRNWNACYFATAKIDNNPLLGNQYTVKVGVPLPPFDKIKALFDNWFNESQKFLKDKLCSEWQYCQKKEQFAQHGTGVVEWN